MLSLKLVLLLPALTLAQTTINFGTNINFANDSVIHYMSSVFRAAQSCVIRKNSLPRDVMEYFSNSQVLDYSSQCFTNCMLEASRVIYHKKVFLDSLLLNAALINGEGSEVVRRLQNIGPNCKTVAEKLFDRCEIGAVFNNCLNDNMPEFYFPKEIVEHMIRTIKFKNLKSK